MASFFRRKKSLIFKLILGVPALWFMIVIFLSFQSADNDKPLIVERQRVHDNEKKREFQNNGGVFEGFQNPIDKLNQIVQPFNPFVNKEPSKASNVIQNNGINVNIHGDSGNPKERVVHEAYDASWKYRDVGQDAPGLFVFMFYMCFQMNVYFQILSPAIYTIITFNLRTTYSD